MHDVSSLALNCLNKGGKRLRNYRVQNVVSPSEFDTCGMGLECWGKKDAAFVAL